MKTLKLVDINNSYNVCPRDGKKHQININKKACFAKFHPDALKNQDKLESDPQAMVSAFNHYDRYSPICERCPMHYKLRAFIPIVDRSEVCKRELEHREAGQLLRKLKLKKHLLPQELPLLP